MYAYIFFDGNFVIYYHKKIENFGFYVTLHFPTSTIDILYLFFSPVFDLARSIGYKSLLGDDLVSIFLRQAFALKAEYCC